MVTETSPNPWIVTVTAPVAQVPVTRRDKNGELYREEPDEERDRERFERKVVPPQGEYTLKLVGISDPFEIPKGGKYGKPGEMQTVAWFEFEIVKGRNLTGRWFSQRWSRAFGKQSYLGKFIKSMTGDYVPYGEPFDVTWLIGKEFVGYVSVSTSETSGKDFPNLNVDTIYRPEPEEQVITRQQRDAILESVKTLYPEKEEAKAMLRLFLKYSFDVDQTRDLSYEQADQALNFFATTPAEKVKELIAGYEAADSDEFEDVGI